MQRRTRLRVNRVAPHSGAASLQNVCHPGRSKSLLSEVKRPATGQLSTCFNSFGKRHSKGKCTQKPTSEGSPAWKHRSTRRKNREGARNVKPIKLASTGALLPGSHQTPRRVFEIIFQSSFPQNNGAVHVELKVRNGRQSPNYRITQGVKHTEQTSGRDDCAVLC